MPTTPVPVALVLSIDVDASSGSARAPATGQLEPAVSRLLDCLDAFGLSATWAVNDLRSLGNTERRICRGGHEPAILASAAWTGQAATPEKFRGELERRLAGFAELGSRPTTLILHEAPWGIDSHVAAEAGLVALRPALAADQVPSSPGLFGWLRQQFLATADVEDGKAAPRSIGGGLWEMRPSFDILAMHSRQSRRLLDRAIRGAWPLHAVVRLPQLAAARPGMLRRYERFILEVVHRRDQGLVFSTTVTGLLERTSRSFRGQPARSILRRAA